MPSQSGPQLGAQVRRLRTERGWTQEELSRYSGVSRPTIARLETGETVRTKTLQALCRALDAQALLHKIAG